MTKMHGAGNDYVYVDCRERDLPDAPPRVARAVARRHHGIGSDGLILIRPSEVAACRMEMYNADGSRGLMCGNGIRCVGKFVFDRGLTRNPMTVETDCGVKTLALRVENGTVREATVDMDAPILDGPRIPVASEGRVIDAPLEVGGTTYRVTCVSMGNPHCVVFVDDVAPLELDRLGPKFEHHPFFPERVNTEFVALRGRRELDFRVWERGSGETMACGTGACAALVAAALTGRSDRQARIHLRGGDLDIEWRADDHVYMTGEAAEVFTTDVDLDALYAATGTA
jgi:diaminopimelate epimerase